MKPNDSGVHESVDGDKRSLLHALGAAGTVAGLSGLASTTTAATSDTSPVDISKSEMSDLKARREFDRILSEAPTESVLESIRSRGFRISPADAEGYFASTNRGSRKIVNVPIEGTDDVLSARISDDHVWVRAGLPPGIIDQNDPSGIETGSVLMSNPLIVSELGQNVVTAQEWDRHRDQLTDPVSATEWNCNTHDLTNACIILGGISAVANAVLYVVNPAAGVVVTVKLAGILAGGCAVSEVASLFDDCDWNNFKFCTNNAECGYLGGELVCGIIPVGYKLKPVC